MKNANDNATMTKAQLVEAASTLDTGLTKTALRKLPKDELVKQLTAWQAAQPEAEEAASRVPQKYRVKYAEAAKAAGHKAHTATGKATLNNGDEFALLWEAILPSEACKLADQVAPQPDKQTHAAKYAHLNVGMQRMNAGNRIRGAIKRGEVKPAKAVKLTKALIKARAA